MDGMGCVNDYYVVHFRFSSTSMVDGFSRCFFSVKGVRSEKEGRHTTFLKKVEQLKKWLE